MVSQCISAVAVLGIVVIAILIMTRAISLEQAASVLGRGFLVLVLAILALCMVKGLLVTAATDALGLLKSLTPWLVVLVLVTTGTMIVSRLLIARFGNRSPRRGDHDGGEL